MSEPQKFMDIQQVDFFWERPENGFMWDDKAEPVPRSLCRYPGSVTTIVYKYPDSGKLVPGSIHEFCIDWSRPGDRNPNLLSYDNLTPPQVEGPVLIEAPGSKGSYRHNRILQDETTLYENFAKLNPDDRESILDFANKWGLLTKGETEVMSPKYPAGSKPVSQSQDVVIEDGGKKQPARPSLTAESLSFWQREIIDMGQVFKVWEWWKDEDIPSLSRVIQWRANGVWYSLPVWQGKDYAVPDDDVPMGVLGAAFGWLANNKHESLEIFNRFEPGDLLLPARYLLQKFVNRKIRDMDEKEIGTIRPRLLMNPENKIRSYLRPSNLLTAMWLQFYQVVCGERNIKRCEVCGRWADITGNVRPGRWKGHPDCLHVRRQAKYREEVAKKRAAKKAPAKKTSKGG